MRLNHTLLTTGSVPFLVGINFEAEKISKDNYEKNDTHTFSAHSVCLFFTK